MYDFQTTTHFRTCRGLLYPYLSELVLQGSSLSGCLRTNYPPCDIESLRDG